MRHLKPDFLLLLIVLAFLIACGSDDKVEDLPCDAVAIVIELNTVSVAILDAQTNYDTDPSAANCATIKTALQNTVDFFDANVNCLEELGLEITDDNGNPITIQETVNDFNEDIAMLPC